MATGVAGVAGVEVGTELEGVDDADELDDDELLVERGVVRVEDPEVPEDPVDEGDVDVLDVSARAAESGVVVPVASASSRAARARRWRTTVRSCRTAAR